MEYGRGFPGETGHTGEGVERAPCEGGEDNQEGEVETRMGGRESLGSLEYWEMNARGTTLDYENVVYYEYVRMHSMVYPYIGRFLSPLFQFKQRFFWTESSINPSRTGHMQRPSVMGRVSCVAFICII